MVYVQLFCQLGAGEGTPPRAISFGICTTYPPFRSSSGVCPLVSSKLQSDGGLFFVEAVQTLDAAKVRVQELGSLRPGESVIHDEAKERVFITAGGDTKN